MGRDPSEVLEHPASPNATFEESTRRLAEIVEALEAGELPLEQSLLLFEEGVKLARLAHAKIEQAERKVEELLGYDTDGRPVTKDLAP
jgi:exodeoxyribonuclease VII small subunit